MSLLTPKEKSDWILVTYDDNEIFLTEDEFSGFKWMLDNGNKFAQFDDGAFAIADVRRWYINREKKVEDAKLLEEPDRNREQTPEEKEAYDRRVESLRMEMEKKGILLKKGDKNISQNEFEKRKKILLEQGKRLQNAEAK